MSVTLKEIAYHAGVHVSVVSRVLNDKADQYRISKQCQERVKATALKLGYIPNAFAVGVRTGKFNCIALLHSSFTSKSYLPEKLINQIHSSLERHDKHLLLANIPRNRSDHQELPKIFRSLMAEGLIVNYCHNLPANVRQAIQKTPMPKVWINYKMDEDAVYPDSFSGAVKAAGYLIRLGHKRISYCNIFYDDLKPNAHFSVADRRDGYASAMKEASLEILDITPDHRIDDSFEKQVDYFYQILKRPDRPSAMLFYWSLSVPAIFAAASRLNLRIPKDLSVMTFAGESHQRVGINTTAMLEPETEMGEAAVAMLWEKIQTKEDRFPSKKLDYIFLDMHTCSTI
jgi:LacI family transcriptional regulator